MQALRCCDPHLENHCLRKSFESEERKGRVKGVRKRKSKLGKLSREEKLRAGSLPQKTL